MEKRGTGDSGANSGTVQMVARCTASEASDAVPRPGKRKGDPSRRLEGWNIRGPQLADVGIRNEYQVNPYVLTGLVMCGVVLIALAGTSYLAVYFTRRAKADLAVVLTPLAEVVDGQANIDEAEVTGTFRRNHVAARMANAAAGTVRIWQTDMLDAAGGHGWNWVYSRPRKQHPEPEIEIVADNDDARQFASALTAESVQDFEPDGKDWLQIEYSPDSGWVRLARPIRGRNDIPSKEDFGRDLARLATICDENRAYQERLRESGTAS